MIGFGESVARFYKNYFNFEGRATRAEYWWPALMQLIVYICLMISFVLLIGQESYGGSGDAPVGAFAVFGAGILFMLFNFIPSLSVAARRFHDLDQTGWLVLVFFVVNLFIFVAGLAQMIWFAFPGTQGPNQYGPDPYADNGDIFG